MQDSTPALDSLYHSTSELRLRGYVFGNFCLMCIHLRRIAKEIEESVI